jgi:AsmA protein
MAHPTSRRTALRVLAGVLVVVAGIGAGLVWLVSRAIDPESYRADIVAAVRRATGREVQIGRLSLRLSPQPRIEAEDVVLANPPGMSRPDMLRVPVASAEVALLPLLAGAVEVDSLRLERPELILERDANGIPNWVFTPRRRALYAESGGGGSGHGRRQVEIHRIHVEEGRLVLRTGGAADADATFDLTRLEAGAESEDAPINLSLEAARNGVAFTLEARAGTFSRLVGPVAALAGGWPLHVEIGSQGARLVVDGAFNHPEALRGYVLNVTGNAPDLSALAPLLGRASLPALREVNLSAHLDDGGTGIARVSRLSVHAGQSDLTATYPGLKLTEAVFSAPGPGQLAQGSVAGSYNDAPLKLALTLTEPDLDHPETPLPVTLLGEAGSASLSVRGAVPQALGGTGLDLTVALRTQDLAGLSAIAGRPLPPLRDVVLEARAQDVGAALRGIALPSFSLATSSGDLGGNLVVVWSPRVAVSGAVTSRALSLDALLAALPPGAAAPPAVPPPATVPGPPPGLPPNLPPNLPPGAAGMARRVIPDLPLPLGWPADADADLSLNIGTLVLGGAPYHDVATRAVLRGGTLRLDPLRLTTAQGTLVGSLSADAAAMPPRLQVALRAPALAAQSVAALLGDPGGLSGAMQLDLRLAGSGTTLRDLAATLDGHFGLAMVDGRADDAIIDSALGPALRAAGLPPLAGSTDLRCLALRADFARGQGNLRTLTLDTPTLVVTGDGQLDLAQETMSLHLQPVLRVQSTSAAAPVRVSGPFSGPKVALDRIDGGRVGLVIGNLLGVMADPCPEALADARGGLPGPLPAAPLQPGQAERPLKRPTDLLKGIFH